MDDKRQHPRVPVAFKVAYRSKGDLQKDLVTDLSPGGLFVRTSKPLPIGTEVDLEVSLDDADVPMHVRGKVIWLRQRHGPEGMGIQFTGVMGPVLAELVEKK
jgi:type IV pilus assembly protein PilZ